MSNIDASIIIPTKGRVSRLKLTLQSLGQQVNNKIEVIVIFDGCTKEAVQDIQNLQLSFNPIFIICPENVGRSAARNQGIAKASGRIIIFLDDDRLPAPNYIHEHLLAHQNEPCVVMGLRRESNYPDSELNHIFNSKLIINNFNQIARDSKLELYAYLKNLIFLYPNHPYRYASFATGNVSIDKTILDKIGMFDENYAGWGVEDLDIGYRLFKEDIKYYFKKTAVNYHLLHERNFSQERSEELNNLQLFCEKFKENSMMKLYFKFKSLLYSILNKNHSNKKTEANCEYKNQ